MRLNVNLKFKDAERKEILKFAQEIGMGVDDFCRRAVFYAINDAYRRAEEAITNGTHNTILADSPADSRQEQFGGSTDSAALPNQTDSNTDS